MSKLQIGPIFMAAGVNPKGVPNSNHERVAVGRHPSCESESGLRLK